MDKKNNYLSDLLRGKALLSNKRKYQALCIGTAIVHLIFAIVTASYDIMSLFTYNSISVIFYVLLAVFPSSKNMFSLVYALTILEVEFYACFATVLLGWNCSFMLYTFAFIPGAFYLENTTTIHAKKFTAAILTTILIAACYLTMSIVAINIPAKYTDIGSMKYIFFFFNTFLSFVLLIVFSFLFALEHTYLTSIKETENTKLVEMSNVDPLTKVLNRRGMTGLITEAIENAQNGQGTFCLVMVDIDFFKKVNDTYGHDTGDVVLVEVAKILQENIRISDYVCRWGGEEFLLLLHENSKISVDIAERIRVAVAAHRFKYKDKPFQIHLTLGVSEYQTGLQMNTIIEAADQKLYYGKEHGRNQVVH